MGKPQKAKSERGIVWEDVDPRMLERIRKEADDRLQAQLFATVFMDARSTLLGCVFLVLSIMAALTAVKSLAPLFAISSALLFVASVFCLTATEGLFWIPGNSPKNWHNVLMERTSYAEAVGGDFEWLTDHIENNHNAMQRWSLMRKRGVAITLFAAGCVAVASVASLMLAG